MRRRHSWTPPNRVSHLRTERACWNCQLVKVTRHEGISWQEFERDGEVISRKGTPECVEVVASAEGRAA